MVDPTIPNPEEECPGGECHGCALPTCPHAGGRTPDYEAMVRESPDLIRTVGSPADIRARHAAIHGLDASHFQYQGDVTGRSAFGRNLRTPNPLIIHDEIITDRNRQPPTPEEIQASWAAVSAVGMLPSRVPLQTEGREPNDEWARTRGSEPEERRPTVSERPDPERHFMLVPVRKFDDLNEQVQVKVMEREKQYELEGGYTNERITEMLGEELANRGLPCRTLLWELTGYSYVRFDGDIDLNDLINAGHSVRADLKEDLESLYLYAKADVSYAIVMHNRHSNYPTMEVESCIDYADDAQGGMVHDAFHKPFVVMAKRVRQVLENYCSAVCHDLLRLAEQELRDTSWVREQCIENDLWYSLDGEDVSRFFISSRQEVQEGDFREVGRALQQNRPQVPENTVRLHESRRRLRRGTQWSTNLTDAGRSVS